MAKTKMSPHEARTDDEVCSLQTDWAHAKHGWLAVDGATVTLARQVTGKPVAALDDLLAHRCALPASIQEALNSGDGTYRP